MCMQKVYTCIECAYTHMCKRAVRLRQEMPHNDSCLSVIGHRQPELTVGDHVAIDEDNSEDDGE